MINYKFVLCMGFDLVDFTLGRIIGFGTLFDMFGVLFGYYLLGPIAMVYAWELLDISDQIDGFVPTLTILYLMQSGIINTNLIRRIAHV